MYMIIRIDKVQLILIVNNALFYTDAKVHETDMFVNMSRLVYGNERESAGIESNEFASIIKRQRN